MERKMFEKVLGRGLRLSQCRLDGHRSCDFEAKPLAAGPAPAVEPADGPTTIAATRRSQPEGRNDR